MVASFHYSTRQWGIWTLAIIELEQEGAYLRLILAASPQYPRPVIIRVVANRPTLPMDRTQTVLSVSFFDDSAWHGAHPSFLMSLMPGDEHGVFPVIMMPQPLPTVNADATIPDEMDPGLIDDLRDLLDGLTL